MIAQARLGPGPDPPRDARHRDGRAGARADGRPRQVAGRVRRAPVRPGRRAGADRPVPHRDRPGPAATSTRRPGSSTSTAPRAPAREISGDQGRRARDGDPGHRPRHRGLRRGRASRTTHRSPTSTPGPGCCASSTAPTPCTAAPSPASGAEEAPRRTSADPALRHTDHAAMPLSRLPWLCCRLRGAADSGWVSGRGPGHRPPSP